MRRGPQHAGFTLLEVLVAAVIVALLAAALAAALHVGFRARRSATESLADVRAGRLALEALGRDLKSALPPTAATTTTVLCGPFMGFSGGGGTAGPTLGAANSPSGLGQSAVNTNTPVQVGIGDSVTFSNLADPTRAVDSASDIEQVTLALVPESEVQTAPVGAGGIGGFGTAGGAGGAGVSGGLGGFGGAGGTGPTLGGVPTGNTMGPMVEATPAAPGTGVLVRRVNRYLLATVLPQPVDQVLCRNVGSFNLMYFDGTQWNNTWNSASETGNALPVAVQVSMTIVPASTATAKPGSVPTYNLSRIFMLPCAATPSGNAAGGGS